MEQLTCKSNSGYQCAYMESEWGHMGLFGGGSKQDRGGQMGFPVNRKGKLRGHVRTPSLPPAPPRRLRVAGGRARYRDSVLILHPGCVRDEQGRILHANVRPNMRPASYFFLRIICFVWRPNMRPASAGPFPLRVRLPSDELSGNVVEFEAGMRPASHS